VENGNGSLAQEHNTMTQLKKLENPTTQSRAQRATGIGITAGGGGEARGAAAPPPPATEIM